MMKKIIPLLILFLMACAQQIETIEKSLQVSKNSRYLTDSKGKAFFYLGDTAWELFQKLDREEASHYLENRARKKFTVIQAVVLAELDGLTNGNAYGHKPLVNMDPAKPNEKYFEHVDFIVQKTNKLGMFMGMLPTWGDKVTDEHGGSGPVIFTRENAEIYGKFVGERYKDDSIIWILGGDRLVTNDTVFAIWESMAKGIREGDGGKHLITYHPRGGSNSSYWFHNEDWLGFNMYQSGHAKHFNEVYHFAQENYLLQPTKPFLDGEPAYEDIPVEFWNHVDWESPLKVPREVLDSNYLVKQKSHFEKGFFTGYDMRVHAYWNLLSGACGHTYGNNAVWQMYKKGSPVVIPCLFDWKKSLDRPGAFDMMHVRELFESRPFNMLVPDQSLVYGLNPKDNTHVRAAVSRDHSFAMAYTAIGQKIQVVMDKIHGPSVKAWWYNPRNGKAMAIGEFKNTGILEFMPPETGNGKDWVLVLDDTSAQLIEPGLY